jgi:hypothetical protein
LRPLGETVVGGVGIHGSSGEASLAIMAAVPCSEQDGALD